MDDDDGSDSDSLSLSPTVTSPKPHEIAQLALRVARQTAPHHSHLEGTLAPDITLECAIDFVWRLGTDNPEALLVPAGDHARIYMLQFVGLWTSSVLPALMDGRSVNENDLVLLAKWLKWQRQANQRRGPFWMGRRIAVPEVVVAPFAEALLFGGGILDSPECAALATWLAAIQASPYIAN